MKQAIKTNALPRPLKNLRWLQLIMVGFTVLAVISSANASRRGAKSGQEDMKKSDESAQSENIGAPEASKGGLRYRVLVNDFEDRSAFGGLAGMSISSAWGEMLTQALAADGRFLVIAGLEERQAVKEEITFDESEWAQKGTSAPQKGHMSTAQLLVKGTIVSVMEKTGGSGISTGLLGATGIKLAREGAEIRMIVKIYDAQTSLILADEEVVGKSSTWGGSVSNLPGNTGVAFGKNKNLAKAAGDALDKAVKLCADQLELIEWSGAVTIVKPNGDVLINRGEREGVVEGQTFSFGTCEVVDDPETGERIGSDKIRLGALKVTKAFEKYSVCEIVSDDSNKIEKKMSIWLPKDDQ